MDMVHKSRRRSTRTHIIVAAGAGWVLSWPIDVWSSLTEDERGEVVDRQTALLAGGHHGAAVGQLRRRRAGRIAPLATTAARR